MWERVCEFDRTVITCILYANFHEEKSTKNIFIFVRAPFIQIDFFFRLLFDVLWNRWCWAFVNIVVVNTLRAGCGFYGSEKEIHIDSGVNEGKWLCTHFRWHKIKPERREQGEGKWMYRALYKVQSILFVMSPPPPPFSLHNDAWLKKHENISVLITSAAPVHHRQRTPAFSLTPIKKLN